MAKSDVSKRTDRTQNQGRQKSTNKSSDHKDPAAEAKKARYLEERQQFRRGMNWFFGVAILLVFLLLILAAVFGW